MKISSYILFAVFFIFAGGSSAQIERVIVETYYISDAFDSTDTDGGKLDTGSVTYRIYVDLMPGNKLLKIYGDTRHALKFSSTAPFFNNVDGETFAKDIKKGKYSEGTVGLDTWLTLGQTAAKTNDGKANFGILKRQDTNGSFIGGTNNNGGTAGVAGGILKNNVSAMGIPLTTADGMDAIALPTFTWVTFGIKNIISGSDSTMFGSLVSRSSFNSRQVQLENRPGATGLVADSNQILIAQLTTKGQLSFELNLEVEQLVNNMLDTVKYVANDSILLPGEKKSSYLKYPFPPPVCGCKDPAFLEYNFNFECSDSVKCLNRIVFGCMDTMACNFDPNANFSIPTLCCYPGLCAGRDIAVVCPAVNGDSFQCDVFPNPTQDNIFLNIVSGTKQAISYTVFNYFGTEVVSENLGVSDRIVNKEIDLSGLSNGIYLVKVNIGNEFVNKEIIKN